MIRRFATIALAYLLALTGSAIAVPEADHVRIDCKVLRLYINDFTVRHQLKLEVTVSSSDEAQLKGLDAASMAITNAAGKTVVISPQNVVKSPKQFKAAHLRLLIKAVEDPQDAEVSNVPPGFLSSGSPFEVALTLRGEEYKGELAFGEPVMMVVAQEGEPVKHFALRSESPVQLFTVPAEFGPVYYKEQDLSNFMYQLANMDQSITSGDFHQPVESPRYMFQVGISDGQGGPTNLIDPSRYIVGYESHMIRSDQTHTPLMFPAGEFKTGDVVVFNFLRQETFGPDSVFSGGSGNFSNNLVVEERVIYALSVEDAPEFAAEGQVEQ